MKRRIELTLRENFCFSEQNRTPEEHFVFGTGEKGNRLKWLREHVQRSGPIGLRPRGGHGER